MDPVMMGALGMAGPVLGYIGQRETNASNESIAADATSANMHEAQRNREFQMSQTSAQMAFQERMANTAHQREMEDMKKAGINPLMTAKSGGAPAPSGAAASGSQGSAVSATMQNPNAHLEGLITSGLQAMKTAADTDNVRMQTAVMSKGIPEAEAKNAAWNKAKMYWDKVEQMLRNTARDAKNSYGGKDLKKAVQSYDPVKKKFIFTNP